MPFCIAERKRERKRGKERREEERETCVGGKWQGCSFIDLRTHIHRADRWRSSKNVNVKNNDRIYRETLSSRAALRRNLFVYMRFKYWGEFDSRSHFASFPDAGTIWSGTPPHVKFVTSRKFEAILSIEWISGASIWMPFTPNTVSSTYCLVHGDVISRGESKYSPNRFDAMVKLRHDYYRLFVPASLWCNFCETRSRERETRSRVGWDDRTEGRATCRGL